MKTLWNRSSDGFSLLELMAVMAIMGTLTLFGLPAIQEWNAKKSFQNSVNDVYSYLSRTRLEALSRSTITKINTYRDDDNYLIRIYYNSSPSAACSSTNGWTQLDSRTIRMNSNFQMTGSGIGDVCFLRDGTSSGGIYNIAQKNSQTNLGNASINVVLTTGFIDVTK